MKRKIFIIMSVVLPLFMLVFLFFVNEIVITIRLSELKTYLQDLDENEGSIDHIALIATYEINKKIYEERITQDTADEIEQKINSLSIPVRRDPGLPGDFLDLAAFPAVAVINFNRKILGKPPVRYLIRDNEDFKDLDLAYYHEKNFLFKQAVILYDKALHNKNLSSTLKASILLRQGYCYALSGFEEKAMYNYNTIITSYSYESSAITASILARYLEGFNLAREKILSGKSDPVLKSQKLVSLLAYQQALDIINATELKSDSQDMPRILYFKARCYSGLGQPEKAIENYLRVITSNPDSIYAKFSNRKLFIIGTSAGGSNVILETSKLLNDRLQDPILGKMMEDQIYAPFNNILKDSLLNLTVPESLKEKVDKLISEKNKTDVVFLVISTSDGNTFKGRLLEKNPDFISIETSIGKINVKTDKITKVIEQK